MLLHTVSQPRAPGPVLYPHPRKSCCPPRVQIPGLNNLPSHPIFPTYRTNSASQRMHALALYVYARSTIQWLEHTQSTFPPAKTKVGAYTPLLDLQAQDPNAINCREAHVKVDQSTIRTLHQPNWERRPPGFPQFCVCRRGAPLVYLDARTQMAFLHQWHCYAWTHNQMPCGSRFTAYREWSPLHKTPIASTGLRHNQLFVKNEPCTTLYMCFYFHVIWAIQLSLRRLTSNIFWIWICADLLAYAGSERLLCETQDHGIRCAALWNNYVPWFDGQVKRKIKARTSFGGFRLICSSVLISYQKWKRIRNTGVFAEWEWTPAKPDFHSILTCASSTELIIGPIASWFELRCPPAVHTA